MNSRIRTASLAAALLLGATSALGAQSLATFGSVEAGGFGEGSVLLGTSLSIGDRGLHPIVGVTAQAYRYRSGTGYANVTSVSPSAGLRYGTDVGSFQSSIGYTFVNKDLPGAVFTGAETGGQNSVFVNAMGNYWGTGENTAQAIGTYSLKSDYYWTRFRAAHHLAPASPIYLGGEVVVQGSQKGSPNVMRYQVGPTLEYRISDSFRVGGSAGLRSGNNSAPSSGYLRLEFLALSRLSGM